jgi:hypothetical protein
MHIQGKAVNVTETPQNKTPYHSSKSVFGNSSLTALVASAQVFQIFNKTQTEQLDLRWRA